GVAERVVVLGEVVDRRPGRRRAARERRRAVIGEAARPELETDAAEEGIDAARGPGEGGRVGRGIAGPPHPQRPARPAGGGDRGHLDLAGCMAGHDAGAAAHAEDLAGAHRIGGDLGDDVRKVEVVVEAQVEVGVVGRAAARQRHQHEAHAVEVVVGQQPRPVVGIILEYDRGHWPDLWNLMTRESGLPAGRYFTVTSSTAAPSSQVTSISSTVRRWPSQRDSAWVMRALTTLRSTSEAGSNTSWRTPPPNSGRNGRSPGLVSRSCSSSSRTCSASDAGAAVRPSVPMRNGKARWRPLESAMPVPR